MQEMIDDLLKKIQELSSISVEEEKKIKPNNETTGSIAGWYIGYRKGLGDVSDYIIEKYDKK